LKVKTTELRDKFRVYKLLTFQYYFSKFVIQLLYKADVFLPPFGVASTHNFLKEPILVHRVTSWARIMELFGMDSGRNCSIIS